MNYAARSVISPDPFLETNEIGVYFVFIFYIFTFAKREYSNSSCLLADPPSLCSSVDLSRARNRSQFHGIEQSRH